jgi:glutamyl/glutaminyl-tRNA synthetase
MSIDDLYNRGIEFLEGQEFYQAFKKRKDWKEEEIKKYIKKVLTVEQERLSKFTEIGVSNPFFFQLADDLKYTIDDIRWKDNSDQETKDALEKTKAVLEKIAEENWTQETIQEKLLELAGEKRGDYLFPLRWVLTGQQKSPSPFEVAWVLGKEESLKRISLGLKE